MMAGIVRGPAGKRPCRSGTSGRTEPRSAGSGRSPTWSVALNMRQQGPVCSRASNGLVRRGAGCAVAWRADPVRHRMSPSPATLGSYARAGT